MEAIENNDVSLVNHIVYTIYNTEEMEQMRLNVMNLLKYLIPYDTANFYLVEEDALGKSTLSQPLNVNSLKNSKVDDVLTRYMEKCSQIDRTHWLCDAKKSMTYRTTDFLLESAFEKTDYYKEMFSPYDVHFGAQVVLAYDHTCVGLLSLFRSKDSVNFSDRDLFYLDCLKDHLSVKLYQLKGQKKNLYSPAGEYTKTYNLTPRESEILSLLFEKYTNEEIAAKLCISENTLRKHMSNLFTKLDIHHRWELFVGKT